MTNIKHHDIVTPLSVTSRGGLKSPEWVADFAGIRTRSSPPSAAALASLAERPLGAGCYTFKRFFPAPGGVRIIIALAGERSLNHTRQRPQQTNGKEHRSAQTRTAPHIVAERAASHEEARLRHHGFSTSFRSTPRTPLNPLRAAPLALLRCVRRPAFVSHLFI